MMNNNQVVVKAPARPGQNAVLRIVRLSGDDDPSVGLCKTARTQHKAKGVFTFLYRFTVEHRVGGVLVEVKKKGSKKKRAPWTGDEEARLVRALMDLPACLGTNKPRNWLAKLSWNISGRSGVCVKNKLTKTVKEGSLREFVEKRGGVWPLNDVVVADEEEEEEEEEEDDEVSDSDDSDEEEEEEEEEEDDAESLIIDLSKAKRKAKKKKKKKKTVEMDFNLEEELLLDDRLFPASTTMEEEGTMSLADKKMIDSLTDMSPEMDVFETMALEMPDFDLKKRPVAPRSPGAAKPSNQVQHKTGVVANPPSPGNSPEILKKRKLEKVVTEEDADEPAKKRVKLSSAEDLKDDFFGIDMLPYTPQMPDLWQEPLSEEEEDFFNSLSTVDTSEIDRVLKNDEESYDNFSMDDLETGQFGMPHDGLFLEESDPFRLSDGLGMVGCGYGF
ncbi:MAG: hypothetical protein ACTSUE_20440 [Promethearchaeota archaeon]